MNLEFQIENKFPYAKKLQCAKYYSSYKLKQCKNNKAFHQKMKGFNMVPEP